MNFPAAVAGYLADPSPANLETLREIVTAAPGYQPNLELEKQVSPHLEAGDASGAVEVVMGHMPGAFLSPVAHQLLAVAYRQLDDQAAFQREDTLARSVLAGILGTGDGTTDHPWSVLMISDEYDVLRALGRSPVAQSLVTRDGRSLDLIECSDGSTLAFALRWM